MFLLTTFLQIPGTHSEIFCFWMWEKGELLPNTSSWMAEIISCFCCSPEPFASWNWIALKRPNRTVIRHCSWSRATRRPSTDERWLTRVCRCRKTPHLCCYFVLNSFYFDVTPLHPHLCGRTTYQPAATCRKSSSWTPTSGRPSRSWRWWRVCWGGVWWKTQQHEHRHTSSGCHVDKIGGFPKQTYKFGSYASHHSLNSTKRFFLNMIFFFTIFILSTWSKSRLNA